MKQLIKFGNALLIVVLPVVFLMTLSLILSVLTSAIAVIAGYDFNKTLVDGLHCPGIWIISLIATVYATVYVHTDMSTETVEYIEIKE